MFFQLCGLLVAMVSQGFGYMLHLLFHSLVHLSPVFIMSVHVKFKPVVLFLFIVPILCKKLNTAYI